MTGADHKRQLHLKSDPRVSASGAAAAGCGAAAVAAIEAPQELQAQAVVLGPQMVRFARLRFSARFVECSRQARTA